MCEVLQFETQNQPTYRMVDNAIESSTVCMNAPDTQFTEHLSFHCSDSDDFHEPFSIPVVEADDDATPMESELTTGTRTQSGLTDHRANTTPTYCLNSLDARHRKCSAPVLCSTMAISPNLPDKGASLEEVGPLSSPTDNEFSNSLSSLPDPSSRFNLTPDIILSPCGPSSSESSSSKPSSVSAFSRLARKLSQDYLYTASSRVTHRCNTVAEGLSTAPFQHGELVSISTRSSSRRLTSWYYSLTASYKTKLDQFRRIFRGTPVDTDRLLVDYSCALSKNNHGLLLQGRMYVTENWICFYSKILYEQKIYLAVKEIIAITKEKTARVIPNAIQILYSKNHERFFFTSFSSRERTFAILRKVWENCRNHQSFLQANQTMSIEEIMQQVREIYGDDSLAMVEDEDTDADPDLLQNSYLRSTSESSDFEAPVVPDTTDPRHPLSSETRQSNRALSVIGLSEPLVRNSTDEGEHTESGMLISRPRSAVDKPLGPPFSAPADSQSLITHAPSLNCVTSPLGPTDILPSHPPGHCRSGDGAALTEPELGTVELRASSKLVKPERKKRSKKRRARSTAQDLDTVTPDKSISNPQKPAKDSQPVTTVTSTEDTDSPAECSPRHDHPGRVYADTEVALSVDALFACIFTDSEFFDRLSTSRGTFDVVQSSWPPMVWPTSDQEQSGSELPANIERTICYTLTLKQRMGPRTCSAVEQQTLLVSESQPGRCYVIDAKVTNQAVPLCNCFCVVSRYCLLRTGRRTSRLRVSSRVVYEKPVFFGAKSIIENTCKSGLTDFFTALTTQLTELTTGLSDEDRLTGGYLAARSTNAQISHDGMAKHNGKPRDKSKDDNKLASGRGRLTSTSGRRQSGVGEHKDPNHAVALSGSSSSSPAHGALGKSSSAGIGGNGSTYATHLHSKQSTDIIQFFLRPDRAWLLMAVIGLLLCLFLSMVYSRLVALEQFAKHLSVTSPGSQDPLDTPVIHPDLLATPNGYQLTEAARARIRAMKDLTQGMSQTLLQMQNVMDKVQQSLELLENSYIVRSFSGKSDVDDGSSGSPPNCPQLSLTGVTCPPS